MIQSTVGFTSPSNGSGSGLPGNDGDSAYQVAVNNGFTGTEQQWLDSLVGADGLNGADGIDGAKGDQGDPGPAGADGADGVDGSNGVDALWNFTGEWLNGVDYAAGDLVTFNGSLYYTATGVYSSYSPGYPGADWVLAASKGADGADGSNGANGIDGADGAQGPKGDQGDPGPAGADGTNGLDGEDGIGMPVGGEAGQILAKYTATDYDFIWIDNYANWTSQLKHEVKLGAAINKGQAVYVSSADGTNMIVSKASNASEQTSSKTIGLLESGGSTNAKVKVITEGLLSGLNTDSANAGDPVWLGTNGNLIYGLTNKPVAPAHLVFIGIVTRSNQNNGEIFIKPQNGFELNEIHDVLIGTGYASTPSDNDLLAYDLSSGLWKNQTAAQAGVQTTITGGATTITTDNLAVNKALISTSGGKVGASTVTSTELAYLTNATGNIQSQLDGKISAVAPLNLSLTSISATDPLVIESKNENGGTGYAGIATFTNTTSGATNPNKYIRMNTSGGLEIVNSAYSDTIFYLADNGNLSELGTVNGATIGDTGWQTVSSFANSFTGTNVSYRKINNVVYLRGRVSGGTAGTGAFTLPSGYRPGLEGVYSVQQYGTANMNYVTIGTDGVLLPNASSAWLSGISFPVG